MAADQEYDVVVLGGGPVGQNAADRSRAAGLSVAVVERELVGGECSYWACMPSKALLRPGAVLAAARAVPGAAAAVSGTLDIAGVLARRDEVTSHWNDAGQVTWLDGAGITLLRGSARFSGPRVLEVTGHDGSVPVLTARDAVVVATGSVPVVPDVEGLAQAAPWTSREATSVGEAPARLAIIGSGGVAVEMATAFGDLGSRVTLLARGGRLLGAAEPFAGEFVHRSLSGTGVDVRLHTQATRVAREPDGVHIELSDGSRLVVDEVLVATGRRPATRDLGLETVGLEPGKPLEVDDALSVTGIDGGWLFAAGDVTGRVATTHQGKYQGRVAGDVIAARFGRGEGGRIGNGLEAGAEDWSRYRATADHEAVPQVVFTRPEVASVGLTEVAARRLGYPVRTVRYDLGLLAGATVTAAGYEGAAQLVIDTERRIVLGATFVGPDVAEMLHSATIAVVAQVPLERLWHAVPAYPTVSEVWLRLLETVGL